MALTPILNSRFAAGMAALRAKKPLEALREFEAVVKADPTHAQAHFQIGQILLQSKQLGRAVEHLDKARRLAPREPAVWQASLIALGTLAEGEKLAAFRKEVMRAQIPPQLRRQLLARLDAPPQSDWGGAPKPEVDALIAALVAQDGTSAMSLATDLNKRFPSVGLITNALATAHEMQGDVQVADLMFRQAVRQAPFDVSIRVNYGRFLEKQEEYTAATRHFSRANELRPGSVAILCHLSGCLKESYEPLLSLATIDEALRIEPKNRRGRFLKAKALAALNRAAEAEAILDDLVQEAPENPDNRLERAIQREHLGRFDEAESDFLAALDLDPNRSSAYREISMIRKFKDADPLFDRLETELKREELQPLARSSIHFALGKMYEDTKSFDLAFPHIVRANELDAQVFSWDRADTERRVTFMKDLAGKLDLPDMMDQNAQTANPIFVSGMPRSGTTLTEQILASHSSTIGVGEARWWTMVSGQVLRRIDLGEISLAEAPARIIGLGEEYMQMAQEEAPGQGRIVDKELMKHYSAGFLLAAMPKAKMVFLKRDPRDNLLSIYKNPFNSKAVTFNNDMYALAWTYAKYVEMLAFWQEMFPGRFHVLDYDRLTAEPEATCRELLAFCDLEWEDDVLSFHQKDSTVKTLSVYQVRQPIYQSSVKSWQRYADGLQPLFDALDEFGLLPEGHPDA